MINYKIITLNPLEMLANNERCFNHGQEMR